MLTPKVIRVKYQEAAQTVSSPVVGSVVRPADYINPLECHFRIRHLGATLANNVASYPEGTYTEGAAQRAVKRYANAVGSGIFFKKPTHLCVGVHHIGCGAESCLATITSKY